jgi:hypothetical protein
MNNKPMLNAYPDSLGGKLSDIAALLKKKEMQDTFSSFYILPSLYHSDLDRGFSVVDYNLNEELATIEDLSQLKELGIDLKLDFILNHASATVYNDKEGQARAMASLAYLAATGGSMKNIKFEDKKYVYLPYEKVTLDNVNEFVKDEQ